MKRLCLVMAAALALRGASAMVVADNPESVHPLSAGSVAPSANLVGIGGASVELSDLYAAKPTIVIFFRGGWCPFCNRHLASLAGAELDLRRLGYQIVAISPDPVTELEKTAVNEHLRYRLLSDREMKVSAAYKVAFRIPASDEKGYKENGINLPRIPGEPDFWLCIPTAFIVGRDGLVKFVYFNPDPSITISTQALMAAAKASAGAP